MGIFSNGYAAFGSYSLGYVEPYKGEGLNYQELGIIGAAEIQENYNRFMKGIALSELASMEMYGTTDVFYESMGSEGIFGKIKALLRSMWEKITKLFHTFIAKMSSWFGDTKAFVKKYRTEITQNFTNMKDDFGFKGYKFSNSFKFGKQNLDSLVTDIAGDSETKLTAFKDVKDATSAENKIRELGLDEDEEEMKKKHYTKFAKAMASANPDADSTEDIESFEKLFVEDPKTKQALTKSDINDMYEGINSLLTSLADSDKFISKLKTSKGKIDTKFAAILKKIDAASKEHIKNQQGNTNAELSEAKTKLFSAWSRNIACEQTVLNECIGSYFKLIKVYYSQAKEICVIALSNKKKNRATSTSESVDYGYFGDCNYLDSVRIL